ncbi:Gfo/Idh/MocA family oxidoreductase [Blastopirellula sp. JC732]|uniref:Gfo/Idh/MocA family oxidoreductase n=1 Tax=Blastopirellula sediminis TaxID=2894196 RepID=A0A9X1MR69_9BACT|nr:Gfo/Idh/MocA family oxidoreductase [Blastopirellula sediminis]MCC9606169.1 Gfo/Idh/MocA family oxidoreductase [Blastopirellula sediminis]MCC9630532.1 Gfo/Idh/MocA family oxidoreductase [Blastopirellula sediminis]
MASSPVRFGVIGFGAWGKCHAAAINNTAGAEVVAVAAKSEKTCAEGRELYPKASVYGDYRQLLDQDDIDVVTVVIPSYLHFEVAKAVLESGKHLLLEKPMCLTIADCQALNQLAQEKNLLLAVGHELRLSSLWSRVKQEIDAGAIGQPQYALVELSRKPYRLGADGWRYDIDRVGNWILEEPIHFFDLARWYLSSAGMPTSLFATANSRQAGHPELQDNFSAIVNFKGGEFAVVSQSLSMFEHHQTAKVAGTEGSLWASWSGAMDRTRHPSFFLKASSGETVREIPIEKITGEIFELEDQVAMLRDAIRDGKPLSTTAEDGMWSVAMCLAAQKSVESGQPIAMSDIL